MSEHKSTEIGTIFRRSITRDINKVVKVEQEDERVVAQELEEYILTAGLERNFTRLLEAIIDSERGSTDEVGIWISGFFGSGKSHFMKILGYLLEDRTLGMGVQLPIYSAGEQKTRRSKGLCDLSGQSLIRKC